MQGRTSLMTLARNPRATTKDFEVFLQLNPNHDFSARDKNEKTALHHAIDAFNELLLKINQGFEDPYKKVLCSNEGRSSLIDRLKETT